MINSALDHRELLNKNSQQIQNNIPLPTIVKKTEKNDQLPRIKVHS